MCTRGISQSVFDELLEKSELPENLATDGRENSKRRKKFQAKNSIAESGIEVEFDENFGNFI